jgi:hypothetical protein
LDRFARRIGIQGLASNQQFAAFPLGGFPPAERVKAVCWGIRETVGVDCIFAAVFDSDYKCSEEIWSMQASLRDERVLAHLHERKEIENYLLVPACLDRAIAAAIRERAKRDGSTAIVAEESASILELITEQMKGQVIGQHQAKRLEYLGRHGPNQ